MKIINLLTSSFFLFSGKDQILLMQDVLKTTEVFGSLKMVKSLCE
jgi:hypothetical protein